MPQSSEVLPAMTAQPAGVHAPGHQADHAEDEHQ